MSIEVVIGVILAIVIFLLIIISSMSSSGDYTGIDLSFLSSLSSF